MSRERKKEGKKEGNDLDYKKSLFNYHKMQQINPCDYISCAEYSTIKNNKTKSNQNKAENNPHKIRNLEPALHHVPQYTKKERNKQQLSLFIDI